MFSLVSATYAKSGTQYISPGSSFSSFGGSAEADCGEVGQDFIVQISPLGCEPTLVRSDLLEENNVPVFCQLGATKINPLIDVNAIEDIDFAGNYDKKHFRQRKSSSADALGGIV